MSKLLSDEELRSAIAKAAEFSRSDGWYFDKVGEQLNATHKVEALEALFNTQKRLYAEKYVEDFYFLLDGDIQMVLEDGGIVDGRKLLKNMRSVADSLTEQRARISR